ncbi:hypothetical protein [Microbacterium trichothecenolyticum]|uniref:hypothetical protein n=1 Tax=Microbacterium trichothecenolyticum TaxID=69370 RepID=UPI0027D78F6F|nr:hypothetical protein [Microbacterium trichothecenolyticum]
MRVAWRIVSAGADRREVSRSLLTELLPGARLSSRCSRCGGDHGRVRVSGAEVTASVSYASGWAIVAVRDGDQRVGIDAVAADATGLDRVLPGADARTWARVEAVLKADGRGLAVDPARVRIVERADGEWSSTIDGAAAGVGFDVEAPPGVVVAVAVASAS